MNAVQIRHEQKLAWLESDCSLASANVKIAERVSFDLNVQFLAACASNDMDEVQRLIGLGVDINVGNVDGLTALHEACIDNKVPLVRFLVENGADVNIPDREGWTALHAAAFCGSLEMTRLLLDHGARVDALSFDNELPIDVASNEEAQIIIEYLVEVMNEKGINPDDIRQVERKVMLTDACKWLNGEPYEPPIDPTIMATPLHIAASKNYIDVMEILLQINGVKVNAVDHDGWTALHMAAHFGHSEACTLLIQHGANINIKTLSQQTVMEVADESVGQAVMEAQIAFNKAKRKRMTDILSALDADAKQTRTTRYRHRGANLKAEDIKKEEIVHAKVEETIDDSETLDSDKVEEEPQKPNEPEPKSEPKPVEPKPEPESKPDKIKIELKPEEIQKEKNATPEPEPEKSVKQPSPPPAIIKPAILPEPLVTTEDGANQRKVLTEAQRTQRARRQRETRRSTQGINQEDVLAAAQLGSGDQINTTSEKTTTASNEKDQEKERAQDRHVRFAATDRGEDFTTESTARKPQLQRPSREKFSSDTELTSRTERKNKPTTFAEDVIVGVRRQTSRDGGGGDEDDGINYEVLYRNELSQKSQLNTKLNRLRRERDETRRELDRLRQSGALASNDDAAMRRIESIQNSLRRLADFKDKHKEYDKICNENHQLRQENVNLVNAIRRLSVPVSY